MPRHALIVVDAQNGFVNRHSVRVVPGICKAIEMARGAGIPIFFTRFINKQGSQWQRWLGWKRLEASPETDLHEQVSRMARRSEVFDKTTYSSIVGPLADAVHSGAFTTVAVCGIATDGCVLKTAVDLFEANVRPIVLADSVASHAGEQVHEAGLLLIGRFIGSDQVMDRVEWKAQILGACEQTS